MLSKPYTSRNVRKIQNKKIGAIYLSKNDECGLTVEKESQEKEIASIVFKLLMKKNPRKRYLWNVAPKNIKTQKIIQKLGFRPLEYTYELINSDTE